MKLAVIAHKIVWADARSPTGYATGGGFPQQIRALSELFDQTEVLVPGHDGPPAHGAVPLIGRRLAVTPLTPLPPRGWRRKGMMARWLPGNLPRLWRAVRAADAVHTPVPGDVGTVGIQVALAQRKRLLVRHCSLWGLQDTGTARFLLRQLERRAGGRTVVLATGLSEQRPSAVNPAIQWIFSTSLTTAEWAELPAHEPWRAGQPPRLVTVGRLEPVKNTAVILHALTELRARFPGASLDVVGDGACRHDLQQLAQALDLEDAVTFHGAVPRECVLDIVAASHLFVLPSRLEGFPKAALEAMACGVPVVATAVSALPALVGKDNGYLLPTPTAGAVVTAVCNLLADDVRLARMSAQAREAARAYTLEAWQETIRRCLVAAWGPLRGPAGPVTATRAQGRERR